MIIKNKRNGFTLLEIIIVIIIVGVLASLALVRMIATVEYSRSTEALENLAAIRHSIERCYTATRDYNSCDDFSVLDSGNPSVAPNAHFTYSLTSSFGGSFYTIIATRNTFEGNNAGDWVRIQVNASGITKSGSGVYAGIQ